MTKFKKIKIGDLFDIHPTKSYKELNKNGIQESGKTPIVMNTSLNNGIGGYSDLEPLEKGNIITFSDTTTSDAIYYQPNDFIGYSHVQGLYSKTNLNWTEKSLLYFVALFKKCASGRFDYAYKFNRKIAMDMEVELPFHNILCPDFEKLQDIVGMGGGDVDMTKIDTSSWKEFKLSDLFDSITGDTDIKKDDITGKGTFVISSGLENNGIIGKTEVKAKVISKNTLTMDMFGNCFYRDFPYKMVTHARVFTLMPKFEINSKEVGLFIASLFENYKLLYDFNNMCSWKKIKDNIIKLPVKETEEVDIQYMEQFMMDLEKVHLMDLERYLRVAGLEGTSLSDKEKFVLENATLKKSFKISDLFTIENTDSYNTDALVDGNNYDYITRTVLNNGINRTTGFISEKGINEVGSFSLELMNMTFFYREREWYAGQFVRKVKFKYEINELRALYLLILLRPVSQILKSVLIRNVDKTFLNLQIDLPIKENGDIDFEYMETYIKAFEKLTIQKIYDDGSIFIDKTRQLIENK